MAYNLRVLHSVEQHPAPLYQPSPKQKTVRIFAARDAYLHLTRDVRRTLLQGCVEFDLRHAQLALAARLWNATELQGFLSTGQSIWTELASFLGVDATQHKPLLKRSVYALAYGMSDRNLRRQLTEGDGQEEGLGGAAARFFQHDLMRELFRVRQERLRNIRRAGRVVTCFGETLKKSRKHSALSLAAQDMHALELQVLLPIVPYVQRERDLVLVAWQHDGFTVHVGNASKRGVYTSRLQDIVRRSLKQHGLNEVTALETEELCGEKKQAEQGTGQSRTPSKRNPPFPMKGETRQGHPG